MNFRLRCNNCGASWPVDSLVMLCGHCSPDAGLEAGRPPKGILEVEMIPEPADTLPAGSDWRANGCLPVPSGFFPDIPLPDTPVWPAKRLRSRYSQADLWIKYEASMPSGSLKDRASYLVAAQAAYHGIGEIALASTGNAGSSMACIGAAAGLEVTLFLPASAPKGKIVQAAQYGARLQLVEGTYDDAFARSLEYIQSSGALSRNTGYNPLTTEGKKTVSFELAAQIGIPDTVFLPVGDGVILSGLYKGFEDLMVLGLSDRVPRIVGVQAEGSSAITRAWQDGDFTQRRACTTLADSISVELPQAGCLALAKLRKHRGRMLTVSDGEILSAQRELASLAGAFAEPSAAAAWAGYLSMREELGKSERVVILITGSGLKDIDSAAKGLEL